MPTLTISRFASAVVMGAQVYENAIDVRSQAALDAQEPGWKVQRTTVRSLRSPLPGNRRLPVGLLLRASPRARREMGRLIYPRGALVHRMKVGLPPAPGRDVLTLHDVGPWRFDDEAGPPPAAGEELRRAAAIVTVSAFSAGEIVDLFGTKDPIVIPNGVDHARFYKAKPLDESMVRGLGVPGSFVLAAGGVSQRKNLEGLAGAWSRVRSSRPDLSLVLAGPPHPRRSALFAHLAGVVRVGRVDDDLMAGLMASASALVVPSHYEGFGLPALEGMAVGIPVVAARTSSLPEVVGDGAILVEPTPEELAQGILWAVSGDVGVRRIVAAGQRRSLDFTWERSAAAHADLWTSLGR